MSTVDESRLRRLRSAVRRWGPPLSAAALLTLAGCQGDYGAKQSDPFMGVHASPMPSGAPAAGAPPAQTASTTSVPALPGTYAATSPAALAGNTTPTPDSPRLPPHR